MTDESKKDCTEVLSSLINYWASVDGKPQHIDCLFERCPKIDSVSPCEPKARGWFLNEFM